MTATAWINASSLLRHAVNQVAHGFADGEIVIDTGGAVYAYAQADSIANSSGIMMVAGVIDADNFYVTQIGYVAQLAGFVAGNTYYLSQSIPGALTSTRPSSGIILPAFKADTATAGFFFGSFGDMMLPDVETVTVNTQMEMNKVYIIDGAGPLDMTLPPVFTVGRIQIVGANGNGWVIKQNAGQSIIVANLTSTVGIAGEVQSNANYECVTLEAIDPNNQFEAVSIVGAPNVI